MTTSTRTSHENSSLELAILKEQRLAAKEQRLQYEGERRYQMQHARQVREAIFHLINCYRHQLAPSVLLSLEVKAVEVVLGEQLDMLPPAKVEGRKSPA